MHPRIQQPRGCWLVYGRVAGLQPQGGGFGDLNTEGSEGELLVESERDREKAEEPTVDGVRSVGGDDPDPGLNLADLCLDMRRLERRPA